MKNFLAAKDAAFYQITRRKNWENGILQEGLKGCVNGRIFVSRTNDEGVLASIAVNQILNLDEEPDLVVLKLSQSVNKFRVEDLAFDSQANELTSPFQSIIRATIVPPEKIEFESAINMALSELGTMADNSDMKLPGSKLFLDALEVIYEVPGPYRYKLEAINTNGRWTFEKRFL